MPRGLPRTVRDNIEKCQMSALAAVEAYNRPGKRFRTAQYLVMIVIAWTALLHAIFYRSGANPWYKARNGRYERIDGEPKHWDLTECLKRHFGTDNPAERKNLEFLIGLRNKIEHRHMPELDPSLYGECQAALLNLEQLLVSRFGEKYSLEDQLAVSLQFSSIIPEEKKKAARALALNTSSSVRDYIETFRLGLPSDVLTSMKYSFSVFLVPKTVNRDSAADAAIEFVKVDEASEEELERLDRLNVLIREKKIPIANLDLYRPSQVLELVNQSAAYKLTMNAHTDFWKHYEVRPEHGSGNFNACNTDFCVYDEAHKDYLYTNAWVQRCRDVCDNEAQFLKITGRKPESNLVAP